MKKNTYRDNKIFTEKIFTEKNDARKGKTGDVQSPVSLYIHIPFCIRKCRYCDFLSSPQDEETRERYVRALIREIELSAGMEADTVFFGGGTPSILTEAQIERIMEAMRSSFQLREDAEISLEMNPGTANLGKLRAFRQTGINRLSIGIQSMHDAELKMLGRIHTSGQAREAYELARRAGFGNISLDLMSALPGQTFETWADTLRQAVEWDPEHISAYSLIIEPGTPFAALQEAGNLPDLPDEETDRKMYHYTKDFLASHGFCRYEISNYAKPGRESRHNSGYWTGHPYLGFGIGAASYLKQERFSNIRSLPDYLRILEEDSSEGGPSSEDPLEAIREENHLLSVDEQMEEFIYLGLRMTAGVSSTVFHMRFGREMEEVYGGVIRKQIGQGTLTRTADGICLTERGTDVSNYVLADYLLS